jgi:Txe/YoeB family toxin of Txe-Axe toxin-antitoxin module
MEAKKVFFAEESIQKKFEKLKEGDNASRQLYSSIFTTIEHIRKDAFTGIQIPKRLIPVFYQRKYKVNSLWKYNLINGWRLIYTIKAQDEITIVAIILEYMKHKEYEKRFNYLFAM